jgi:hypothetical protein
MIWETFCDESYFHQWAVRRVGETRWGRCFHVPTQDEATGLCAKLNGYERLLAEARERIAAIQAG